MINKKENPEALEGAPTGVHINNVNTSTSTTENMECEAEKEAIQNNSVEHILDETSIRKYVNDGKYQMTDKGLTYKEAPSAEKPTPKTEWICSSFEIIGASRDPNGRGWGKILRWRDGDGRVHLRHVSDSALQGPVALVAQMLADENLVINRSSQKKLVEYLAQVKVPDRVTIVSQTGWHADGNNFVFVLPNKSIGQKSNESFILDSSAKGPYESKGNLIDWYNGVGRLAGDHALAVLAISAALAGPLLRLAGQEGGGINFFGLSSKGKSTLLQLAASVWGRGGSPGYVRAWRATANGLEGAAASASDTVLVLDELGVIEVREVSAAVYGLANGAGKARSARNGDLREPKTWRILMVSCGEMPIERKLCEEGKKRAMAGQLVRLLDIPIERGMGFGAFDHGGTDNDAAQLSKNMKNAAVSAYGTVGPEFVRRLITENINEATVRALVDRFVTTVVPNAPDGQVDRAAQRLGLIVVAGELAIEMGLVPWRAGAVRQAAAWAFARWIENRGGTESKEESQAIEAVRLMIEQFGQSRFETLDGDGQRVLNRLGWTKGVGPSQEWWIPSETWKVEICVGMDPKFVAATLGKNQMLGRSSDGWQMVKKIAGNNIRVYVVLASIFEGGTHGP